MKSLRLLVDLNTFKYKMENNCKRWIDSIGRNEFILSISGDCLAKGGDF